MRGQRQEIDLSISRLENVSIVEKRVHIRANCRHWRKEQTEDKDQKLDDEKDTIAIV